MTPPTRRLDVCVCTFRRDVLEDTLRSFAALRAPLATDVRIIVADNDETPSARAIVERVSPEIGLPVRYIHAPARNISLARNACLDASDADLLAFIDDDETATSDWLAELVQTIDARGADVVLGPVRATYGTGAPLWMVEGEFHSTRPVWRSGKIDAGYTCNVLIRTAAPSVAGRRFRPELGRSGGEDTAFFAEVGAAGGIIDYAPQAWVEEIVPEARASLRWLAARRFRMGQTHGRLIARDAPLARRAVEVVIASSKLGYCGVAALMASALPVRRNRGLLRGSLHAGVVAGLLGMRELQQYGTLPATGNRKPAP